MAEEIPDKFQKPYDPGETEDRIYTLWEESGFFNPDNCIEEEITPEDAPPFSMVLPPPNVTGVLHLGHAFEDSLQDIVVRYKRMRGHRTLWIPGTDHAAIATQAKVEKKIYKEEKKNRHDLGRENFLERVEQFAQESHDTIIQQIKKLGASLDWSRESYTLDEDREKAVRTAFKKLYDMGLIYRGTRIVNWDPKMQTTVSDDEIEYEDQKTPFYYLQYGPFTIATARPETKFGDKYVVMHPEDDRYSEYEHGQKIELEWINGPITATIIKDDAIDPEFGTGVMTITPWHDATDFEIAERHDLEKQQIINEYAKLLPVAGEFEGENIRNARPQIVEKLDKKGLLVKVDEDYTHRLARNSRGSGIIEPQIKKQWFIDVNKRFPLEESKINEIESGSQTTLKEIMKTVVETGQIEILPDRFNKNYFHWIDNLRDWCISRQIWYGHRIPVWYKESDVYVDIKPPEGAGWEQDPDTLDTWFSSGLWTFSTLGWPDETDDFKTYHPTSFINPGYEILFFWVARMVLMSGSLLGEIPFETIYLHGIVRDSKGRKFSKSLGNGIDPVEVIDKYGADALRMGLIVGVGPGSDSSFDMNEVKGYKHFANKIWNASKFTLMHLPKNYDHSEKPQLNKNQKNRLDELHKTVSEMTEKMEECQFHLAAERAYHYFWHTFADEVIEENKEALYGDDEDEKQKSRWVLFEILQTSITVLHPFMPFVTEEVWSHLPVPNKKLLLVTPWPHGNNR